MPALAVTSVTYVLCGNYVAAEKQADAFGGRKTRSVLEGAAMMMQGCVLAMADKTSDAVRASPPELPCGGQRERRLACHCIYRT